MKKVYFTSESVTSGHPDKICDLIADSILDAAIAGDPESHMAVEATIKDEIIIRITMIVIIGISSLFPKK